jgi:hypothetical protein
MYTALQLRQVLEQQYFDPTLCSTISLVNRHHRQWRQWRRPRPQFGMQGYDKLEVPQNPLEPLILMDAAADYWHITFFVDASCT